MLKFVDTNLHKICRLCLYQGFEEDFVPIIKNLDLLKKIEECVYLELELTNKFPSVICLSCMRQVNQWITFREVCHQSHNILIQTCSTQNDTSVKLQDQVDNHAFISEQNDDNTNEIIDSKDISNFDNENKEIKLETKNISSFSKKYCSLSNGDVTSKTIFKRTRRKCVENQTKIKGRYKKRKRRVKEQYYSSSDFEDSYAEDTIEALEKYLYKLYQEDAEKEFHHIKQEYIYKCNICNETFNAVFDYLDHQEIHNGEPVFRCEKCEQVFNTRHELVEHDNRHQVPCSKCGKMVLPGSLKTHMVLHTDKYKCTQCNWRFCNSTMLKQHVESVHIRLKTHVCETCGKSFTSTTSLQTHIKIHSDVRSYTCKICAYSGRTASALYTHMARHENGLHFCEVCAKSFKSFRSLRDHTRRVHSKNKNHECGFCHKKFVDKYMLTVHTRTHTGARPYECNQCDRAFVRSDGLRDHLATHSQRAIYHCEQCGKKFIYRRSLGRHVCVAVNKL